MRKGSLLLKEEKSSKGLLSATKVVFFWSDFYETWSSRKIGDTGTVFPPAYSRYCSVVSPAYVRYCTVGTVVAPAACPLLQPHLLQ